MKGDLVIALDIGGTFTKGCVIEKGIILEESVQQFDSLSNESAERILNHFVEIIDNLFTTYTDLKGSHNLENKNVGIGLAFPGPFDYEQGISYIRGLNKFEALYNLNVRDELLNRLQKSSLGTSVKDIEIRFENDGRLFGLGASTKFPNERLICLTIGTGLGSVFIDHGKIIKDVENVPADSYLYNQAFRDATIDDHFSRRGILNIAAKNGIHDSNIDVKELAKLAMEGNEKAQAVFEVFGEDLAEMLQEYIRDFQPDRIVIGGQIAKSFDLFGKKLTSDSKTAVSPLGHALPYTFLGINQLFQ